MICIDFPSRVARSFNGAIASTLLLLASLAAAAPKAAPAPVPAPATAGVTTVADGTPAAPSREMLQFRSASHVLGFTAEGMLVAGNDHLLKVRFAGARPVVPEALVREASPGDATPGSQGVAALGEVHYRDLWPGIDLRYDQSGIVRSTWTLAPGASVEAIRLAYNVPFEIAPDGALSMRFGSGKLTETAPIAWQQIDGQRKPVTVAFQKRPNGELGFRAGAYDATEPLIIDPTLLWNSFLGGSGVDVGAAIATDAVGNVYVAGFSSFPWGTAGVVRIHSGGDDAFVAQLSGTTGGLGWYTFLGSGGDDNGLGIATDTSGHVYVTGFGTATWVTAPGPIPAPVRPFSGEEDAFVAQLSATTGKLVWFTFLGSGGFDRGQSIANDDAGNVYVTGYSTATWPPDPEPAPLRAYSSAEDGFVAKLSSDTGALAWNTFLGGEGSDFGYGIATNASGIPYATGASAATWGDDPVRDHAGGFDAYVVRMNATGTIAWSTFLGSGAFDYGYGIATDGLGDVYVAGRSDGDWDVDAVRDFAGGRDAFAARLAGDSGVLTWHTFLGSPGADFGYAIASDVFGNVYVTGRSPSTWGAPVRPISPGGDAFVARLTAASGALTSHSFLGGEGAEEGFGIACDALGSAFVTGSSDFTWGTPVRAHSLFNDAFVVKMGGEFVFADGFE